MHSEGKISCKINNDWRLRICIYHWAACSISCSSSLTLLSISQSHNAFFLQSNSKCCMQTASTKYFTFTHILRLKNSIVDGVRAINWIHWSNYSWILVFDAYGLLDFGSTRLFRCFPLNAIVRGRIPFFFCFFFWNINGVHQWWTIIQTQFHSVASRDIWSNDFWIIPDIYSK